MKEPLARRREPRLLPHAPRSHEVNWPGTDAASLEHPSPASEVEASPAGGGLQGARAFQEHAEDANPEGDASAYVGVWAKPTPPHMPVSFLAVASFSSLLVSRVISS